jgi:microcystin-dependent protein
MKRTFLFSTVFLLAISMFGQNSGLGFNYQAVVRSADGFVVPSQNVELRFSLMPGQTATQASWQETHSATTDAYGTIGVTVGKGTRVGGVAAAFTDVNFAAVHYWLRVEIREGGAWRELSYSALTSVPYAEVATVSPPMPAGTVVSFMGDEDKVPAGWLLCDGREVNRSDYPALYAVIGTAWGYGNNSTTFNLPDLRGVFERGVSGTSGKDADVENRVPLKEGGKGGNNVGSYQGDAIRNITGYMQHIQGWDNQTLFRGAIYGTEVNNHSSWEDNATAATRLNFDANYGSSTDNPMAGHANGADIRPKNVYVYKIIKF